MFSCERLFVIILQKLFLFSIMYRVSRKKKKKDVYVSYTFQCWTLQQILNSLSYQVLGKKNGCQQDATNTELNHMVLAVHVWFSVMNQQKNLVQPEASSHPAVEMGPSRVRKATWNLSRPFLKHLKLYGPFIKQWKLSRSFPK